MSKVLLHIFVMVIILSCIHKTNLKAGSKVYSDTFVGNSTLVLFHDTTVFSVHRKADRDTVMKYLPMLISGYDIAYFDSNSSLPSLDGYKTILIFESAYVTARIIYLGQTARNKLKSWLSSGVPGDKKTLISFGADLAYFYSRQGSPARDTTFSHDYLKYIYRSDNASIPPHGLQGIGIDNGNSRWMTVSPPGGAFFPDGVMNNGGVVLYKYNTRTANDSVAGIGFLPSGYIAVSMFQDPRYFLAYDFKQVLRSAILFSVNGGCPVTFIENQNVIVSKYALHQNYPNPFNPSTNILFDILEAGKVTLQIFDASGRLISTLVNSPLNAGQYSINWNASELSSGVYYYRITSGTFVQTKRMVLVK